MGDKEFGMLSDNEIKKVTEDALGSGTLAKTLEEIVCSSETPRTIGVYGEWGTGKSSLMRMTQGLLEEGINVKTIWFDAWKFYQSYDLRVALVYKILREIKEDRRSGQTIKEKAGELLKRVNWFGLGRSAISLFAPSQSDSELGTDTLPK